MFQLLDGRTELYQWDLNRQIKVNDASIKQVHFCNKTSDCSLVVEVNEQIANIPNVLLQTDWDIRVYGYTGDYTKHESRFKVNARTKPESYIYTEEEHYTVESAVNEAIEEAKASGEFNGEDGYTPVKGIDYWTEEDKEEMVADVLAALPNGDEVYY